MATDRHLTWENVRGMIAGGIPRRIPVLGDPVVELLVAEGGEELGLLLPYAPSESPPLLSFVDIKISKRIIDSVERWYLFTQTPSLHREFYSLLLGIADEVQLRGTSTTSAIETQIRAWQRLLKRNLALSPEAEVGLWGELWFLKTLVHLHGPTALDSWVGPAGEPHDFRLNQFEIEVKTTRMRERRHRINGLSQLAPTEGKRLFLYSLQVQPSGESGWTLPDLTMLLKSRFASDAYRWNRLESILADAYGLDAATAPRYTQRFELRSSPMLVDVEDCPRLTLKYLRAAVPVADLARIHEVEYTVDVADLGWPDGSVEFANIVENVSE
jgi:hypothetical protein